LLPLAFRLHLQASSLCVIMSCGNTVASVSPWPRGDGVSERFDRGRDDERSLMFPEVVRFSGTAEKIDPAPRHESMQVREGLSGYLW
jgi:hypothetical protein